MAAGGLYDQLGGGFARYSTDEFWLVPHFEKMLYDNATLLRAYTQGWLVTGEPRYQRIVEETVAYLLRDLRRPGRWVRLGRGRRLRRRGGPLLRVVARRGRGGLRRRRGRGRALLRRDRERGNFEGSNILHVVDRTEEPPAAVLRARAALFERRTQRVRPGLDDKVLLAWNALAARALAEAGAALRAPRLDRGGPRQRAVPARQPAARRRPPAAVVAGDRGGASRSGAGPAPRVRRRLRRAPRRRHHPRRARRRLRGSARRRWIAGDLLRLFHDDDAGGFFTTGVDAPALIVRPKDYEDNATPSENSLAADALLRLAALTGREPLRGRSRPRCSTPWLRCVGRHPVAFGELLQALERSVSAPAGDRGGRRRRRRPDGRAAPRGHEPSAAERGAAVRGRPPAPAAGQPLARGPAARRRRARPPTCASASLPRAGDRPLPPSRARARPGRAQLSCGVEGAGGEGLGDGPAERDHRLAPRRVVAADELDDLRAAGRLDRRGVEDRHERRPAATDLDPEGAVVEVAVVAEALGEPPAPRPLLARGVVRRAAERRSRSWRAACTPPGGPAGWRRARPRRGTRSRPCGRAHRSSA